MELPPGITAAGAQAVRALLDEPGSSLVGLDFDGTLAPIVDDPDAAVAAAGAADAVRSLARRVATVAVVTGRPASVAVERLGLGLGAAAGEVAGAAAGEAAGDGVVVLGHYGLQRWEPQGGVVRQAAIDTGAVASVRAALPALLDEVGAPPGTRIEDKGESLAVHVRRTADPAAALALLSTPLAALAVANGLRLEPGRMVLEVRPGSIDKGRALEDLVAERRASVVWYAGDDLGDLSAFEALERLRARGRRTLAICCASGEVAALAEQADVVLAGPDAVVALLAATAAALSDGDEPRSLPAK
jgi:trehalose 6-phosphate phosphatase